MMAATVRSLLYIHGLVRGGVPRELIGDGERL